MTILNVNQILEQMTQKTQMTRKTQKKPMKPNMWKLSLSLTMRMIQKNETTGITAFQQL